MRDIRLLHAELNEKLKDDLLPIQEADAALRQIMDIRKMMREDPNCRFVFKSNSLKHQLSMGAYGLLHTLVDMDYNGVPIVKSDFYDGIDSKVAISKYFKELYELGLLESKRITNGKGKFIGWNHKLIGK